MFRCILILSLVASSCAGAGRTSILDQKAESSRVPSRGCSDGQITEGCPGVRQARRRTLSDKDYQQSESVKIPPEQFSEAHSEKAIVARSTPGYFYASNDESKISQPSYFYTERARPEAPVQQTNPSGQGSPPQQFYYSQVPSPSPPSTENTVQAPSNQSSGQAAPNQETSDPSTSYYTQPGNQDQYNQQQWSQQSPEVQPQDPSTVQQIPNDQYTNGPPNVPVAPAEGTTAAPPATPPAQKPPPQPPKPKPVDGQTFKLIGSGESSLTVIYNTNFTGKQVVVNGNFAPKIYKMIDCLPKEGKWSVNVTSSTRCGDSPQNQGYAAAPPGSLSIHQLGHALDIKLNTPDGICYGDCLQDAFVSKRKVKRDDQGAQVKDFIKCVMGHGVDYGRIANDPVHFEVRPPEEKLEKIREDYRKNLKIFCSGGFEDIKPNASMDEEVCICYKK